MIYGRSPLTNDGKYEIRDPDGRVVGTIERAPETPVASGTFGWRWPLLFLVFSLPAGLLITAAITYAAGLKGTAAGWVGIGALVAFHTAMYLNRENFVGRSLAVVGFLSMLLVAWVFLERYGR